MCHHLSLILYHKVKAYFFLPLLRALPLLLLRALLALLPLLLVALLPVFLLLDADLLIVFLNFLEGAKFGVISLEFPLGQVIDAIDAVKGKADRDEVRISHAVEADLVLLLGVVAGWFLEGLQGLGGNGNSVEGEGDDKLDEFEGRPQGILDKKGKEDLADGEDQKPFLLVPFEAD